MCYGVTSHRGVCHFRTELESDRVTEVTGGNRVLRLSGVMSWPLETAEQLSAMPHLRRLASKLGCDGCRAKTLRRLAPSFKRWAFKRPPIAPLGLRPLRKSLPVLLGLPLVASARRCRQSSRQSEADLIGHWPKGWLAARGAEKGRP